MEKASKTALVVVADGSESLETVTIVNVLRRAGVKVTLAALGNSPVAGTRGIALMPDTHYDIIASQTFDLIVLPGGENGAKALGAHAPLIEKLRQQRLAHRWIGAICAAPAFALAPHGLLDGKQATCYPAFRDALLHYVDLPAVSDGHTVTGQGPASAIAFALLLVEKLCGDQPRREVAEALLAA